MALENAGMNTVCLLLAVGGGLAGRIFSMVIFQASLDGAL